ncbi:MAG: aminotransferase class V-fold PLP-dependent enzyme [Pseudoruegeria sp.]
MLLSSFKNSLDTTDLLTHLRSDLIGEGAMIPGTNREVPLVYADYVASGRALRTVEDFIASSVLPYYANSHTEASYCGGYMTRLRREARSEIGRITGSAKECAVIFTGSGATAGLNRLVNLLGVVDAINPVVFIGPYEHHSNILPWRESGATVVEIPEDINGGPDLEALEQALQTNAGADLKIGSFSAASNVTGILTDPDPVTRLLKTHGARSVWDYAGAGPYVPISMKTGSDAAIDAVVVSPHKFPGGPAASGVLILRESVCVQHRPSWPGGGTVSFVSPWDHAYSEDLATREEAGTPNVIGDIRAALAFLVKEAVGEEKIAETECEYNAMAQDGWGDNPQLTMLGADKSHRLPIYSFLVRDADGSPIHQQLFTRMLSDIYGIQARGGCACAGPYAHRLLDIDQTKSEALFADLQAGRELQKPGWVRLNFSYLMSPEKVQFIIDSVNELTRTAAKMAPSYVVDHATARFKPMVAAE